MNMLPSLVRTYVPLAVSVLVGWLVSLGLTVDDEARTALVSGIGAIVAAIYYAAVRVLERKFAWATLLLGSSQQPTQYAPAATVVDADPNPPAATATSSTATLPGLTFPAPREPGQ